MSPQPIQVSIIIPTRDCLEQLPRAIDSVLAQQLETFEVLVVDDGSEDGTWDWLCARARHARWLRPIRLGGHGAAHARNQAIAAARGELVAFLDADDCWYPGKLAAQLALHRRDPELVMSFTNYRHVGADGEDHGDCFSLWPGFRRLLEGDDAFRRLSHPAALLFAENVVGTSTVVARRDALHNAKGFDRQLHSAEDWDLWLRLASAGAVGFSPRVYCDYERRAEAEAARTEARLAALAQIIRRYRPELGTAHPLALRRARARLLVGEAEWHRAEGRPARACASHLRALSLNPQWRTLRGAFTDGRRLALRPWRG
ncbi:glycosyl transferase [Marichromatium purpuratum 984]|uniref:Glycosyl transferase n=1 Tax=Marichromatium purpuratum 984 TaxID=765910 RepID=W0E2K3_MARPU|nr:glycosyltransferase [Marichromatium purpuratum]AHF03723.1 glycosyl transferase [Marichromatium purpuratum 984]